MPNVLPGLNRRTFRHVRPTSDMDELRPTHTFIGLVAVGLQDSFPMIEELPWAVASTPHTEVERRFTPGLTVLPQVRLVIAPAAVPHLHRNRGLAGL